MLGALHEPAITAPKSYYGSKATRGCRLDLSEAANASTSIDGGGAACEAKGETSLAQPDDRRSMLAEVESKTQKKNGINREERMSLLKHASGRITRRGLLQGATVMGVAGLLLPSSACRAAAQPRQGGILRIGLGAGSITDKYDPALWASQVEQVLHTARCGYLTEIAPDGSLIGEVAKTWEGSDDSVTWTFKIRPGVSYHSGKTVTADDVIASINYHRGPDSKSAAKVIVKPIVDIRKDGPSTVVFTLDAGNADFPFLMSDYHLAILPSEDGKIDPTTKDGCGGYIIESWEPGVVAKLRRYPNYWKADRAHFEGAELITIQDSASRQNALMTGDVDVIDPVDLTTVKLLERAPQINILSITGTQHYAFAMDTRAEPFSNKHVRLALKYAIDRQELVDKILSGYGSVGNDQPIGPSQRFYAPDIKQHSYDPDKARFHLKEAGLDRLEVQLSAANAAFSGGVDSAVLYSERAVPAGIDIKVVREPDDGYWDDIWMKKPFCETFWSGRPTADWQFSLAYAADAPWNETYWDNPRFNELLVAARSLSDDAKRREMYREMQAICSEDGGSVIPMFANYVMGLSDKVAHPEQVAGNFRLDGLRAIERWWFA